MLPAPDSTEATASWTHRTMPPAAAQEGPETYRAGVEHGYLFTSSRRSKCSFLFTSHLNEQDWKLIHGAYEPGKAGPHNEQGHLQWVAAS